MGSRQLLTASNVTGNALSLTTVIALDGSHAKRTMATTPREAADIATNRVTAIRRTVREEMKKDEIGPPLHLGHCPSPVRSSSRMRSGRKVRTRRMSRRCEDQGERTGVVRSASGNRAPGLRADAEPRGISQRLR